jgi:hypothetical protein
MPEETLSEADFLEEVQAFVSEKWQRNPCDRCGTFQWSVLPGNAMVLGLRAQTPRGEDIRSASSYEAEFIPVYCNNCGNTVNIFKNVFDEWRRRRNQTT